jgi:hypothetical protein
MNLSLSPSRFTAVRIAFWLAAAGLLALAGYLLFLAPINVGNECPYLAKSLYYHRANSWCVRGGHVMATAGAVVGSIAAAGMALAIRRAPEVTG